jgi:hypothetical protein
MIWSKQIGTDSTDEIFGLTMDSHGNVLIAGTTEGEVCNLSINLIYKII